MVYIKLLQNGRDLSTVFFNLITSITQVFKAKKKTPFKKVYVSKKKASTVFKGVVKDKDKEIEQIKIDEILDKISKSGYDSLTKQEKDFLFKVGK